MFNRKANTYLHPRVIHIECKVSISYLEGRGIPINERRSDDIVFGHDPMSAYLA